jgi:hypothetical protein
MNNKLKKKKKREISGACGGHFGVETKHKISISAI